MKLIGHDGVGRELEVLARDADPPHAVLLAGPEQVGRQSLALHYAQALNCERMHPGTQQAAGPSLFALAEPEQDAGPPLTTPCGTCRPCRLIAEGAHPDIVQVGPGDTLCRPRPGDSSHPAHPLSRDIRICQVRGIIDLVSRYPLEARWRVVVIAPADRLALEASNTILKTLEEPPGRSVFVLIAAAPEAILETIQSRCRRIDVHPVPRDVIASGLVARGIEPALAARAAEASRGRPGRALACAAEPGLMEDAGRLLARCAQLAASNVGERLRYAGDLAVRWRKDAGLARAEFDAWEAFWEGRLRLAAGGTDPTAAAEAVAGLRAVTQVRADLLANVQARPAIEFMTLQFPRVTLEAATEEEEASTYAD